MKRTMKICSNNEREETAREWKNEWNHSTLARLLDYAFFEIQRYHGGHRLCSL